MLRKRVALFVAGLLLCIVALRYTSLDSQDTAVDVRVNPMRMLLQADEVWTGPSLIDQVRKG